MLVSRKGVRRRLRKAGFVFHKITGDWTIDTGPRIAFVPEYMLPEEPTFEWSEVVMFVSEKDATFDLTEMLNAPDRIQRSLEKSYDKTDPVWIMR